MAATQSQRRFPIVLEQQQQQADYYHHAAAAASTEGDDDRGHHQDPSDPRAFLMEMRRRTLTRKGLQVQQDETTMTVEHLIRTTRAILATNEDIWDRCKPFYCGKVLLATEASTNASTKRSTRTTTTTTNQTKKSNSNFLFYRLAHSTVKARTRDGLLVMDSALEVTKRSFSLPLAIPYPLNRMIVVPKQPKDDIMPNFGLLLKRSMLLSEEILVLYLMELKDFLEKLQVALGDIDAWLLETETCQAFLHEHFGMDLDCFEMDANLLLGDLTSKFDFTEERSCLDKLKKIKCSRCGFLCGQHHDSTPTIPSGGGGGGGGGWVKCPTPQNNTSSRKKEEQNKDELGFFPVAMERSLLLCRFKGGSMKLDFRIDEEGDRKRLIHFLSFVSSSEPSDNGRRRQNKRRDGVEEDQPRQQQE